MAVVPNFRRQPNVAAIETPDAYTVRFVLSRPSPSLISSLATGWFVVGGKHIIERDGDLKKALVGTGPFKLKSYTRGVSIEMERNPNYSGDAPPMARVIYRHIPEGATQRLLLEQGDIDIARSLGEDQAALIVSHSGVVEGSVMACLPELDGIALGRGVGYCEGVRLTFEQDAFVAAAVLRV